MKKYLVIEVEDDENMLYQSINEIDTVDLVLLSDLFKQLVKRRGDYRNSYIFFVENNGIKEASWLRFNDLLPMAVIDIERITLIKLLDVSGENRIL